MLKIIEITDKNEWDGFINRKGGHPLQLWGWGELKKSHGWKVKRIFIKNSRQETANIRKTGHSDIIAAAQILVKKLPFPLKSFSYIPRGAVILSQKPQEQARLMDIFAKYCKENFNSVCLSIEPDWEDSVEAKKSFTKNGWKIAKNTILIPQTLILDLKKSEDELLSEMSKKTRQYIRKSSLDISVREINSENEINKALEIYQETAKRANFQLHNLEYYHSLKEKMKDNSPIYGAFIRKNQENINEEIDAKNASRIIHENEEMVAFLWLASSKKTAFELYGGMNEVGQKYRANYILKWLAIQQIRNREVEKYDFNGLLNDGVSKFKEGFSSHQNQLIGTLDKPLSPWYFIWSNFLPMAKKIIRKFKK